jgi:hypothetical protein
LHHERIDVRSTPEDGPVPPLAVIYCGACGQTLHVGTIRSSPPPVDGPFGVDVAAPSDQTSLEGRFQLRCRDLITEIRALGFDPYVWAGLINDIGAVAAARRILTNYGTLPVTRWLMEQGHPELTLEREVEQLQWADLFNDQDRTRASRRLESLDRGRPDT